MRYIPNRQENIDRIKSQIDALEFAITDNTLRGIKTPECDRDALQILKWDLDYYMHCDH